MSALDNFFCERTSTGYEVLDLLTNLSESGVLPPITESEFLAILLEGVYDPYVFKAVFMAGGPGSGKTFISDLHFGPKAKGEPGLKYVSSDDFIKFKATQKGIPMDFNHPIHGPVLTKIRAKSQEKIQPNVIKNLVKGRRGFILDGTGRSKPALLGKAKALRSIGYDLAMIFVDTTLEVAQARNAERERKLTREGVKESWDSVQANKKDYISFFGKDFFFIKNNNPLSPSEVKALGKEYRKKAEKWLKKPVENPKALRWIMSQIPDKVFAGKRAKEITGIDPEDQKGKLPESHVGLFFGNL